MTILRKDMSDAQGNNPNFEEICNHDGGYTERAALTSYMIKLIDNASQLMDDLPFLIAN